MRGWLVLIGLTLLLNVGLFLYGERGDLPRGSATLETPPGRGIIRVAGEDREPPFARAPLDLAAMHARAGAGRRATPDIAAAPAPVPAAPAPPAVAAPPTGPGVAALDPRPEVAPPPAAPVAPPTPAVAVPYIESPVAAVRPEALPAAPPVPEPPTPDPPERAIPDRQAAARPAAASAPPVLSSAESAPEPPPPGSPETAAPSPLVAPLCGELSIFGPGQALEAAIDWLEAGGFEVRVLAAHQSPVTGYWVLIPPAPDRGTSIETVRRLKAAGVEDVWRFSKGEWRYAISLGLFKGRPNAEKRRAEVAAKGFDAEVRPRFEGTEAYRLEYRASATAIRSEDIRREFVGRLNKVVDCDA